ncbi:hypothetical protein KIH39_26425 [Telmatocola sphagniphila]|uniref:Uncharacterized protein n=1 Tax=Telmatocola sphagniphila TaxID=1123043 RepID=A0A8E6B5X2_9BACT|nr:hypothetical protein [Telmatocola sphagniphila]QVL32326.1 hypothetical protein KIH39_26425 [Telmatocola sphagniphila]
MPELREGTCASCGAKMLWSTTKSGRSMPLDTEPAATGNILLHPDGTCEVVPSAELEAKRNETPLYLSHFATCPGAASHRKPKE